MGIFDSIKSVYNAVFKSPASNIKLPVLGSALTPTNPKTEINKAITALSAPIAIAKAPKIATSAATLVKSAFSSLKPTTKLALLTASVPTAGLLIESPKARKAVVKTPSSLYNFGSNIGKVVENPSLSTAKNVFTENPILAGGTAAAGGLILGKGIFSTASAIANTSAIQANTKATQEKSLGTGFIETMQQSSSNKFDLKQAEEETKRLKLQLESNEKIAKIQAEAAEKLAKQQQVIPSSTPVAAEAPLTSSTSAAPPSPKKKKKKKAKKKTKKKRKTKKKAKTIKRRKPIKKKKTSKKKKKKSKRKR